MTQDIKALLEEYCTTPTAFEEVLSTLLMAAHGNEVDVSGAWETRGQATTPEWDVVITLLAQETASESGAAKDGSGPDSEGEEPTS